MDLHYKIHADSDHVAKFQGDRSRELGERVAKKKKERKKKHHEHFISPPVTTVNGRPNEYNDYNQIVYVAITVITSVLYPCRSVCISVMA